MLRVGLYITAFVSLIYILKGLKTDHFNSLIRKESPSFCSIRQSGIDKHILASSTCKAYLGLMLVLIRSFM